VELNSFQMLNSVEIAVEIFLLQVNQKETAVIFAGNRSCYHSLAAIANGFSVRATDYLKIMIAPAFPNSERPLGLIPLKQRELLQRKRRHRSIMPSVMALDRLIHLPLDAATGLLHLPVWT
jgi:hypothetical protein